jgi:DNA-binding MarR family transcriptional regulator
VSAAPVPLARLFAMALRSLVDDLHVRLRERGWEDARPAYGFVLLAAREGSTSVTELAQLAGMTNQAASKLVDSMEAADYVARTGDDADQRRRPVVLTEQGRRFLATVEDIYTVLEEEWSAVIGRDQVEALRAGLTEVLLDRHGGRLPPVRPPW